MEEVRFKYHSWGTQTYSHYPKNYFAYPLSLKVFVQSSLILKIPNRGSKRNGEEKHSRLRLWTLALRRLQALSADTTIFLFPRREILPRGNPFVKEKRYKMSEPVNPGLNFSSLVNRTWRSSKLTYYHLPQKCYEMMRAPRLRFRLLRLRLL